MESTFVKVNNTLEKKDSIKNTSVANVAVFYVADDAIISNLDEIYIIGDVHELVNETSTIVKRVDEIKDVDNSKIEISHQSEEANPTNLKSNPDNKSSLLRIGLQQRQIVLVNHNQPKPFSKAPALEGNAYNFYIKKLKVVAFFNQMVQNQSFYNKNFARPPPLFKV